MGSLMSRQAPQINQEELGKAKIQSDAKANPNLIFLSHSGHDKPFVTKLYEALCDAGHRPFFDTHSLPAGEPFPERIFLNASGCRVGVVVLSTDFLTSRWPMMELHSMHTSSSTPLILPLFYKIRPDELRLSSPRFSKWRNAWKQLAKQSPSRVNLIEWEAAITHLPKLHGVVHDPNTSEQIFIKKVVHHINSVVPPLMRYMSSHVTGCKRLTQEVVTLFEEIPSSAHFEAQVMGLYGVGGQGKTTMCKLMVNHYTGAYAGRCALIEFPSGDCQEAHILNQCKNAIQQLTTISEHRISRVHDFDQCLQLLKERVVDLGVFIAIDNIWERYLEYAQRIVDVFKLSKESKLLVTSRSGQVLINLLKDDMSVRPLPSVNKEEAHQIFINSFNRNRSDDLDLEESVVDYVTQCSQFEQQYHPLAIKALSVAMGRMDREGWPATQSEVREFLRSNDNAVAKAIRINYDSIPETRRQLFLDVALIYIPLIQGHYSTYSWAKADVEFKFDHLHTWLTALYQGRMNERKIIGSVMQLAYDGLFKFEISSTSGQKEVRMHDLYTDLAVQEGVGSGKFLVDGERFIDTNIKYMEVERMVLEGGNVLRGEALPNLQLLMATNWDGNGMELIPDLRILVVQNKHESWKDCNVKVMSWKNSPNLAWLELRGVKCEDISELSNLLVLKLHRCSMNCKQLRLNGLVNLQVLDILGVRELQEITGLDSLVNLKIMTLEYLPCLRKVDIGELTQLQVLEIGECPKSLLKDLKGVGGLSNLKALRCPAELLLREPLMFGNSIQAICLTDVTDVVPRLFDMYALESLYMQFEGYWSYKTHGIYNMPKLKAMVVAGGIMHIGYLGDLPSVESVLILDSKEMTHIEWSIFHGLTNLKEITICDCYSLEKVTGHPHHLTSVLSRLVIDGCDKFEEVEGRQLLTHCEVRINEHI